MIITSRENKIFKTVKMLKTAKGRSEKSMFIIEGTRSVKDAIEKGAEIYCIIIKDNAQISLSTKAPVYAFAPKLFNELSETVTPQEVMAVCCKRKYLLKDLLKNEKDCIVLCEALQDPGNIGTVIRTAHAAGAAGVVLTKGCCDLYNPKIVRATMTGIFSIPVAENIASNEAIEYFRKNGYRIVAGGLCDDAVDFYDVSLKGKCVIIIGNEGNGVSKSTLSSCDDVLKIPMQSDAESLNAAVAGAIMMYEHYRQNR